MKKYITFPIIKASFYSLMILVLIITSNCSPSDDNSNNGGSSGGNSVLTSLEIMSSNGIQLDLNGIDTTVLTATGRDQFNEPITIISNIEWSTNNDNLNITSSGLVTAISTGSTDVMAKVGSISTTITIGIIDSTPQSVTSIYVSDAGNFEVGPWKIFKYDENGQNPEVFIDEDLAWPQDIVFLEDNNEVLISNLNSGKINRHNATTGALLNSFATGIGGPTRMKIGPDNLLYVLQWSGNGSVLRYQLDGTFVDQHTDIGVVQSIGLDWDSSGNLYVSSFNDKIVRKFDSNGNNLGIYVNSNLQGPTNIWFDENDNLFVCDWTGGKVVKFDMNGNFTEDFITGLNQVEGVDIFPNGNIILGNGNTSEVKLYDAQGNFIQNLVSSGSGGLLKPNAVVIR